MVIKKKISTNKSSLSKTNDKRGELLIKVDELMEKLNNDYGPLLLEDLQKRIESTIEEFHSDLKIILENSFKNHDRKLKNSNDSSDESIEASNVPSFIAEYEEKRKKNK